MSSRESARGQEGRSKRDCPLKRETEQVKKTEEEKKRALHSPLSSILLELSERAEGQLFSRAGSSHLVAMILSFYLPAMVVIVLTALATCVLGERELERRGRERETSGDALFVFPMHPLLLPHSLSTSTPPPPR